MQNAGPQGLLHHDYITPRSSSSPMRKGGGAYGRKNPFDLVYFDFAPDHFVGCQVLAVKFWRTAHRRVGGLNPMTSLS